MKKYQVEISELRVVEVVAKSHGMDDHGRLKFFDAAGQTIAMFSDWRHFTSTETPTDPKLLEFYRQIIKLTVKHEVENDNAVVYSSSLDTALQGVDSNWALSKEADIALDRKKV